MRGFDQEKQDSTLIKEIVWKNELYKNINS